VDDEVGALGSVTFEVWTDGVKRYDSGLMTGSSATKQISLPMTGVNQLRLVVTDGGDGRAADHADWAGAQLRSNGTSAGTPTALPNGPSANPSGQSMPVGDLPGWRQIFAEDFTTDAPVGSFPGSAYGSRWDVYPDGSKDTAGAQGGPSRYYPSKVLGVGSGVLTKYLHTENGIPLSAAILPRAGGKYLDQLYGKYTVRYRAESVPGFRVAWMLWPQSNVWPRDGEINFPETGLDGYMCGFVHHQDGTPFDQSVICTGVPLGNNVWHTASIEWSPDRIDFILDGVTVGSSFSRIPNTPMHWVLQTEACYDVGCPDPTTVGKIEIDWAVIYAKAN
jgi:hypothetical protein